MKVMICIPSAGSSSDMFNIYLWNMWSSSGFPEVRYSQGSYICRNRCELVRQAIEYGADYMLFLDNDMIFPADLLNRLVSHGKDVVCGNYYTKERPARGMCVGFRGERLEMPDNTNASATLQRCLFAPTGQMLIDMRVFDRIEKPWFFVPPYGQDCSVEMAEWLLDRYGWDIGKMSGGEDYWFCWMCQRAGVEVWVDWELSREIGHQGSYVYSWRDSGARDNLCNEKYVGDFARKVSDG